MSEYTKGEWKRFGDRVFVGEIHIADCVCDRITENEETANAQLIASAPDLLEACEIAFNFISSCGRNGEKPYLTAIENKLESAIKKAKGEK